jgi:hypothetical protein
MINPYIDYYGNQLWQNNAHNLHRTDGPAYIEVGGYMLWWVNRVCYHDNKSFQEAAGISDEDMLAMILKYGNVGNRVL